MGDGDVIKMSPFKQGKSKNYKTKRKSNLNPIKRGSNE